MSRDNFDKIDEEYFQTILDEDFKFNGLMKFEDSCIIKGNIKGRIESKSDLIIGPNAFIEADIVARRLECFGRINGKIVIEEEAYFHTPAVLNGSIDTKLLTFERGCKLNGNVKMDQNYIDDNDDDYYRSRRKKK
jgi:cytoskeletal protein CcmA (bactofilin family)